MIGAQRVAQPCVVFFSLSHHLKLFKVEHKKP